MNILYKEKPTGKLVEKYTKKLEEYLSAHEVKISLEVYEKALGPIKHTRDGGKLTGETYIWLGDLSIKSDNFGEIKMGAPRFGFSDLISDKEIWLDAYQVQNFIYSQWKKLDLKEDLGDPYWKLWDYINK